MLFDPHGRELKSPPKRPVTEMLGAVRIRDQWSSYPSVKLTPEKLAGIFREADAGDIVRQAELFDEMEEKDPMLGSVLHTRRLAVQGLDIEIRAASKDGEDQRRAEALKENIDDLDMDEPFLYLLDGIGKGVGAVEINWQISEGQAWIHNFDWIPQKRWTYNDFSAGWEDPLPKLPRLLTDEEPIRGIDVPPFKVIYHRYSGRSGFAQRSGLLRGLAYYYLFKNYDIKDWVVFLEKFGQPLRIGKFTPGASAEDIKVLKEAIQDLGTDAAALISDQTMIEIVEAKFAQTSGDLYKTAAEYFDKIYEIGVLGQTATTEGTPGKLGSEEARSQVRDDILKADARSLQKTLRWQLAWPWVGFNFGWDKKVPEIRFVIEEPEDLVALSTTHETLQRMGVPIPLGFAQKKYGIPAPEEGEEILAAPQPAPDPFDVQGSRFNVLKKKVPIGSRLVPFDSLRAGDLDE